MTQGAKSNENYQVLCSPLTLTGLLLRVAIRKTMSLSFFVINIVTRDGLIGYEAVVSQRHRFAGPFDPDLYDLSPRDILGVG
jgi:hypothetical protein